MQPLHESLNVNGGNQLSVFCSMCNRCAHVPMSKLTTVAQSLFIANFFIWRMTAVALYACYKRKRQTMNNYQWFRFRWFTFQWFRFRWFRFWWFRFKWFGDLDLSIFNYSDLVTDRLLWDMEITNNTKLSLSDIVDTIMQSWFGVMNKYRSASNTKVRRVRHLMQESLLCRDRRSERWRTFHFDLAKFFFICALTDAWMSLSSAVLPEILTTAER